MVSRPDSVWKKSSYSGTSNCVEVAIAETVLIRDSGGFRVPSIECGPGAWRCFIRNLALPGEGCPD
ncbi:DUF397 domain-containing protein [Streptomyces sp. NPDC002688]|uniref:DUF397 domain-containing protein n=1 Tax=Streptomyces sp. NPDC002688 TaxID=3154423 RepID=UPI00332DAFD8